MPSTQKSPGLRECRSKVEEQEEEEEWIEAYGWNDDKEEEEGFGDLFADPDPFETFHFTFELDKDDSNRAAESSDNSTINIMVRGHKAENGQTLNSTGLTLWRASNILCEYLLKHSRRMIQHKSVLELGAGLGICGILAHKLDASVVVLTDGDTNTLQALRQNVALNTESNVPSSRIQCKQLRWGKHLDEFASSSCISKYQVIIGSDVVYAQDQLEPLFNTVSTLLDPKGTFLLAFTRRNVSIDCVLDCANIYGFSWTEPDCLEGVFAFYRKML